MRKKLILILLLAAGISSVPAGFISNPVNVYAAEAETLVSGNYTYQIQDGTAVITSYAGTDSELTIPEQLDGYPVTIIGNKAFYNNTTLKKVTLADSIKLIEGSAFSHCENLETVETGKNLTEIRYHAFGYCEKLTEISFHDQLTTIGFEAFDNCKALKEIVLPESLEKIEDWAFQSSGLETVTLPSNVTSIGKAAFSYCSNLREFTCSDNLKTLDLSSFDDARQLKKIVLGKNTQMIIPPIYSDYFDTTQDFEWDMVRVDEIVIPDENPYLKNVDNVIYTKDGKTLVYYLTTNEATSFMVPEGVTTIGQLAFTGNHALESVQLSNTVKTLQHRAFCGCKNLTSIAISDSVQSIPGGCFQYCSELTRVNLPSTVKTVKAYAFQKYLKVLTVGGSKTTFEAKAVDKSTTIVCGKNSKVAKYNAKINSRGNHIIYHLDGGVNNAANVYYFTRTFKLNKPTRPGYTFAGWYTNAAKTKKISKVTARKNYVLYAKWVKETTL